MIEEDYFYRVCDFYHIFHCTNCFVDIYQSWQTFYFQHGENFSFAGLLLDETVNQESFEFYGGFDFIPTGPYYYFSQC